MRKSSILFNPPYCKAVILSSICRLGLVLFLLLCNRQGFTRQLYMPLSSNLTCHDLLVLSLHPVLRPHGSQNPATKHMVRILLHELTANLRRTNSDWWHTALCQQGLFLQLTVDHPQRIEVCWGPSVNAEDLLSVPDHSGQVAWQHHLQARRKIAACE